jgi:hypothetical protein
MNSAKYIGCGLDVAENIRASGGGRKIFLTCPYIEQAISRITGSLSGPTIRK